MMMKETTAPFKLTEAIVTILITFILFRAYNRLVEFFIGQISLFRDHTNPWRLKNTIISWSHSVLISILVSLNYYISPQLYDDMINVHSRFALISICVSMGYFLYDATDLLISNKKLTTQNYEVLLHHFVVLFVFCVPIFTNLYVGYAILSLTLEFNTVFLHLRALFVLNGVNKGHTHYRFVSILNLVTFFLFRIITLAIMTRWILLNRRIISMFLFSVGSLCLFIMMVINVFLLRRLIIADFFPSSKETTPAAAIATSVIKENSTNKKAN